ncbi:ABC transporter ATP-binding protein [Alkalibaculum bacchi]|uniref:ABC transporter ATP-binding protein n=1 Tax=Alkalibaculum bacchi TaxID=645887 RepID=UPI0026EEE200|nr:ABC transporter ATP-binding protein [Alkalibaculum bacchi]
MSVLGVNNVYKSLGKREIIKGIDFSVEEGEIFGFLGPNGAGKTTTIKMIVGLIRPDKGSISINGADILKDGNRARAKLGAVVENPEMYNYLSGMANLKMIAEIRKIPKQDILDVVELVDLSNRIDDKVGKYSLGMKQRLGLACALLGKPKLLILDEPTNGLDPSGIIDFRNIVKNAVKELKTSVFISSHILSEVQQLCTRVAFINHGEIKSMEDLINGNVQQGYEQIAIVASPVSSIKNILDSVGEVSNVVQKGTEYCAVIEKGSTPKIIRALVEQNVDIYQIYQKQNSLEQRYMELVEGGK